MKIEYLGHACFKLDDQLVIDPYKDGSVPGLENLRTSAVKVICTHEHADHSGRECVEITPGECEFEIEEVPSFHDDQEGALRGPNTIFVVAKDGEKLVHLGDLGHFPNEEQLKKIADADYLLIPVGGYYTIDAEIAMKICERRACAPSDRAKRLFKEDAAEYETLIKSEYDAPEDVLRNDLTAFLDKLESYKILEK